MRIASFLIFAGLVFAGAICFFPSETAALIAVVGGILVNESFRMIIG
jgi:hypothetical protein